MIVDYSILACKSANIDIEKLARILIDDYRKEVDSKLDPDCVVDSFGDNMIYYLNLASSFDDNDLDYIDDSELDNIYDYIYPYLEESIKNIIQNETINNSSNSN